MIEFSDDLGEEGGGSENGQRVLGILCRELGAEKLSLSPRVLELSRRESRGDTLTSEEREELNEAFKRAAARIGSNVAMAAH
jgi:hypothetical protein